MSLGEVTQRIFARGSLRGLMAACSAGGRAGCGVAAARAIRWVRECRETGSTRVTPQGGDMRSRRIEAYRDVILGAIQEQVDITLVELAEMLRSEHEVIFAPSTI